MHLAAQEKRLLLQLEPPEEVKPICAKVSLSRSQRKGRKEKKWMGRRKEPKVGFLKACAVDRKSLFDHLLAFLLEVKPGSFSLFLELSVRARAAVANLIFHPDQFYLYEAAHSSTKNGKEEKKTRCTPTTVNETVQQAEPKRKELHCKTNPKVPGKLYVQSMHAQ